MLKKTISLILIFVMILTVTSLGGMKFSDINGHWAEKEIEEMSDKWIILGKQDGTFGPDEYIIKSHAFLMFSRLMGYYDIENAELIEQAKQEYSTLLKDAGITEGIGEISFLLKKGVIDRGYVIEILGSTKEKEQLTRQEAAYIFVKLLGDDDKVNKFALSIFNDSYLIKDEYQTYVEYVNKIGLMIGYDNSFDPEGFVTRAQIATILSRITNIIFERTVTKVSGMVEDVNFKESYVLIKVGEESIKYELSKELKVYKNNKEFDKQSLKKNDKITVWIDNDGVARIYINNIEKTIYTDFLGTELVDDSVYIITKQNNVEYSYKISENLEIKQDDKNIKLENIELNEDIEILLINDEVAQIIVGSIKYAEQGILEEILIGKENYVTIRNLKGETKKYLLNTNCTFDFDGAIGNIYDLRLDMDIRLGIVNYEVDTVKVETLTNIEILSGIIQKVLPKIYVFTMKDGNNQLLMIFLDEEETLIRTENGVGKSIDDIKENDNVSVYGRYEGEVFYPIQVIIHQ